MWRNRVGLFSCPRCQKLVIRQKNQNHKMWNYGCSRCRLRESQSILETKLTTASNELFYLNFCTYV